MQSAYGMNLWLLYRFSLLHYLRVKKARQALMRRSFRFKI